MTLPLPVAQDGYLPFDLALQRGCPAPVLALLEPGSGGWLLDSPFQPLVSAEEINLFKSLSHLVGSNLRRLQRIINVYATVIEVAKRMPLSEGDSSKARLVVQMSRVGRRRSTSTPGPSELSQRRHRPTRLCA